MPLNTELKITVTNNGKDNNNVSVSTNLSYKLSDVLTSVKMAENSLITAFSNHIEKNYGGSVTEKEYENLFKTLKMEDLNG